MKISIEKLKELAHKLKFDMKEEQYLTLQQEFEVILKQMELLGEIENVDNLDPLVFPFMVETLGMRDDDISEVIATEDVLRNASDVADNMIKINKVV